MKFLHDYSPPLKLGAKVLASEVANYGYFTFGTVYWVDGDNGDNNGNGQTAATAFKTIANAITKASAGDVILIKPLKMTGTSTDPVSYAETVTLTKTLALIGLDNGRTQGGLPQINPATTASPLITVQAPGCLIMGLGINGVNSTGGGILLDDDGGSTKSAFGTTIVGCHFKNCVGSTSTNAATGGAIMWAAAGNAWQVLIKGNRFYKNTADVVLKGTSGSVPQDVVIEDNVFSGPAASVDCQLYLSGGSGMNGVQIRNNVFPAFPAIGSGSNLKFMVLTGCVGSIDNNFFGANGKTYKVGGTGAEVPATMFLTGNYQEVTSAGGTTSSEFSRST